MNAAARSKAPRRLGKLADKAIGLRMVLPLRVDPEIASSAIKH